MVAVALRGGKWGRGSSPGGRKVNRKRPKVWDVAILVVSHVRSNVVRSLYQTEGMTG